MKIKYFFSLARGPYSYQAMQIINGTVLAEKLIHQSQKLILEHHLECRLDIVFVGENSASKVYVSKKRLMGKQIGVKVIVHRFLKTTLQELMDLLIGLASDKGVNGIIIQLPVPGIKVDPLFDLIPVSKDVDGLNPRTLGELWHGRNVMIPATANAILLVLEQAAKNKDMTLGEYLVKKNILIINRSLIIGKPLAGLLTNMDATVTLAHSLTKDLPILLSSADIVISGTGVPGLIKAENLKQGAVVIDAGFHKVGDHILGDVGTNDLSSKVELLSPVPNGVGPLGVACLLSNTVAAAYAQK